MKIGILGAGGIAVQMAKTVAGMKDVENYAVAARSFERAQAFAEKYGFSKAYGSYEEMLADPQVDLVPIIIFMQRCAWRQEKMCFVKRRLL